MFMVHVITAATAVTSVTILTAGITYTVIAAGLLTQATLTLTDTQTPLHFPHTELTAPDNTTNEECTVKIDRVKSWYHTRTDGKHSLAVTVTSDTETHTEAVAQAERVLTMHADTIMNAAGNHTPPWPQLLGRAVHTHASAQTPSQYVVTVTSYTEHKDTRTTSQTTLSPQEMTNLHQNTNTSTPDIIEKLSRKS